MLNETITLSHHNGSWYAKSDNPRIAELFGTDTIRTAYFTSLDAVTVGELMKANKAKQGINATILFDFILWVK